MSAPELVTPELLRGWPLPDPEGSKSSRGQVVVVGGAATTPGGVALAGLAALRVGAGRLQLALAASVAAATAAAFPEAGVLPLPETTGGSVSGHAAAAALHDVVGSADAVLVGPGLDDVDEAVALLDALLPHVGQRSALVLDAYALGALARSDATVTLLADRDGPVVLTPNSRELALLAGMEEPADDTVGDVARRYAACVTSSSTIADREGHTWRVPQGHPGLATAGSGDVLSGLVAGVLARGADAARAACWATYLHATAGERLSSAVGGLGFLARELVDQVPPVLAELA